jgi:oligopeptide/dipeptide ABC transporter ATP-binding protein
VIADRIAVMYLGKIMEIGPAEAVIRSPQNPYTRALVSVSPSPVPPEGEERRTILVGETPDAAHIPSGCRFHPRCPLAFDRCRAEEPPLIQVGDGHLAACWLAGTPAMAAIPVVEADAAAAVPDEPVAVHDETPGPMATPGEAVETPPVPAPTIAGEEADVDSDAEAEGALDVTVTRGTMLADALREDEDDATRHRGDR